MMTEGVTEAENPAGECFGAQILETSAALRLSPEGII
jgi:serine phosphatase RsbU (regulator of sigma subunit)